MARLPGPQTTSGWGVTLTRSEFGTRPLLCYCSKLAGSRHNPYPECDVAAAARGYVTRIARKGGGWMRADAPPPPPPPPPQYRRTRWIVERTLAWLSKCRTMLVRYEKKAANHLGFVKVACILLWYRRARRQSG